MIETGNPTPRLRSWMVYASYVIAFTMVICFAAVAMQFLQGMFPAWDAHGVFVVCALAAAEAVVSFWLVKNLQTIQKHMMYYRVTEWVLILVIVKVFTELRTGPSNLWNNILLWPEDFFGNFFTLDYFFNLLLAGVSWLVSYLFSTDLYLLGVDEAVYLDERVKTTPVRDLILKRYIGLGMIVVLLMGLAPLKLVLSGSPAVSSNIAPVIMYFVLGLVLISLTRYASLEVTWQQAKIQVPPQVQRRWLVYSAVTIGILAILAAWLPTNYANGFFDLILTLLKYLGLVFLYINYIFIFLFTAIYNFLLHLALFGPQAEPLNAPAVPNISDHQTGGGTSSDLARTIIFWAIFAILVIIALRQYLAYNRNLAEELKKFQPWRWLSALWKNLKAAFSKANKSVGEFVQAGIQRLRNLGGSSTDQGAWDYINLRRLNPRQRIIFYYLALVRKAEDAGIPRQRGQTPYEYARSIISGLDEGKDGVAALTESFIEARYSRHDIQAKEANRIKSTWEAIRRVIRGVRKSRQEAKNEKGH